MSRYLMILEEFFKKDHPNPRTRTIENYLKAITTLPPPFKRILKSVSAAGMFNNGGNKLFSMGDCKEAVIFYTRSLRVATPYSACSAVAYANRSAALYHLGAFKECIADIDRALKLPYPENLKPSIIARKEAAIAKLNNDSNPAESRNSAPVDDLKYTHGKNAKLPGVSCGIEIARTPRHGRGLVAKKPFQPGDVLLAEKPYMAVPLSNIYCETNADELSCHHCLKMSMYLIPCDRCCNAIYCSEECRTEAHQNYHRIECHIGESLALYRPLNTRANVLLRFLNILTKQGTNFDALYEFEEMKKNPDSAQLIFTEEQFIENKEKVILDLKTNKPEEPSPSNLFDVAYIVVLLRNYTNFFETEFDIFRIAKLLVKVHDICAQNCLEITFPGRKELKGFGVFPLISLANHACRPNTIAYMDKDERIVVRASHYIKPGDQIFHSYHYSFHFINRTDHGSGTLHSKRYCRKCDDTFVFPIQRQLRIQIDKSSRRNLLKNPHHIESLWKVLKSLLMKELRHPIQIQAVKILLTKAYEERIDHGEGLWNLQTLGIL